MKFPRGASAVDRSPWRLTLALAVLGHAAALALGSGFAPAPPRAARAPEALVDPFDLTIAVEIAETAVAEPRPPAASGDPIDAASAAIDSPPGAGSDRERAPTPRERAGSKETKGDDAPASPGPESPRGGEYDPLPAEGPRLPGLGGAPAWSVPGVVAPLPRSAAAPTTTPQRRFDPDAATRGLRGTLDARDQERGMALPAAGEAARAIEAVMESAEAPGESRATFAVDLDAAGNVKSVTLGSTHKGDAVMWARVLARIKQVLAARQLTMRGDAASAGAHLSIRIDVRERYPNGKVATSGKNGWGEHATRVVLAHVDVVVPGQKRLPEGIKPIVDQPFFRPPDPQKSGVVPLTPAEAYRLHTPQQTTP